MIGVFDSGSGGLTVLQALRNRAPSADYVYFGDLAHMPYGNKTRNELHTLTRNGFELLLHEGAQYLVSACNSVSASVKSQLLKELGVPETRVLSMVSPTVVSLQNLNANVLLVATRATIESRVYEDALIRVGVSIESLALPDLVACIEEEGRRGEIVAMLRNIFVPHIKSHHTHIVLGCTHFPLVKDLFKEVLSDSGLGHIVLFDPADPVAEQAIMQFETEGTGNVRFIVSKYSNVFEERARSIAPHAAIIVLP